MKKLSCNLFIGLSTIGLGVAVALFFWGTSSDDLEPVLFAGDSSLSVPFAQHPQNFFMKFIKPNPNIDYIIIEVPTPDVDYAAIKPE